MIQGELIDKEQIDSTKIVPAQVQDYADLTSKLKSVQRLGNEFKSKANITFNTTEGPKTVATTVWSVTEKYIQLKHGILIPLNSIIDIDY